MKKLKHPYQIPSSEKRTDIRILPFEENAVRYEYCFIIMNPFYKKRQPIKDFDKNKTEWIEGDKLSINKKYEKFTWTELINETGITDIKELIHCLYVSHHNYISKYQKIKTKVWESFQKAVDKNQLIPNSDSHLSILLIDPILNALKKLNYENIKLYDVFQNDILNTTINELLNKNSEFPSEFRLLTEDKKLLFFQEYEHYQTFIYSTDLKLLNSFLDLTQLEGFFATDKTTLLWNEIEYKDEAITRIEPW
ncbi:hypothetical protein [Tenacibaculum geojense]|uniref:Uncharacterized protein n=1 Tax=Tenacibaculum geojense TaxID=915352 RepID=A0ABW3JMV1_9FLAO